METLTSGLNRPKRLFPTKINSVLRFKWIKCESIMAKRLLANALKLKTEKGNKVTKPFHLKL